MSFFSNDSAGDDMNKTLSVLGRILLAAPFLLTGVGIIPEERMDEDLEAAGTSRRAIPALAKPARALSLLGGLGIASGMFPRSASCALITFLVPATIIGHPFWRVSNQQDRTKQFMNFTKNVSMLGGLLVVLAAPASEQARTATLPE
jgi:putative oxidoreductase